MKTTPKMPKQKRQLARAALLGGAALLLAGCTQFGDTPAGTPYTQLIDDFGEPTISCDMENGSKRAVWSQQPYGETAWAVDISPDGQTGQMTQVLNDAAFDVLHRGIWTPDDVRCHFGPPANEDKVGPPGSRKVVWSYRYMQNGVWHSLMYVYFGSDGKQVTSYNAGPDPMFMYDLGLVNL